MQPDRELAADLLQESFVKIWREADKYRSEFGENWAWAWMNRVARNTALDSIRRNKRRPEVELLAPFMASLEATNEVSEHRADLERCLRAIVPARREAILLSYIHGFTNVELAARLDTPLGTLKSWLRRGLQELRLCLQN